MESLLDPTILRLIAVAVIATSGIFVVIVLSGILSALLTLGTLELFFRQRIHRSVLNTFFQSKSPDHFESFLGTRYRSQIHSSPIIGEQFAMYKQSLDYLRNQSDILPKLSQMDRQTFYQLHYSQLCGQLTAVIHNENLFLEGGKGFSPMTDILAFMAELQEMSEGVVDSHYSISLFRNLTSEREDDIGPIVERYYLERALRQVDIIQAKLGTRINSIVYGYSSILWASFYAIVFILGALHRIEFAQMSGVWSYLLLIVQGIGVSILAFSIALALGTGTAVFGGAAFTWFDRIFASK